jgi:glutamate-1-semialdehyde aminotransferase
MSWIKRLKHKLGNAPVGEEELTETGEPKSYSVQYVDHNISDRHPARSVFGARVTLENSGNFKWQSNPPDGKCVDLAMRLDGEVKATHKLPRAEVPPGERVTVHFPLAMPADPGSHTLELELVQQQVALFRDRGAAPLSMTLVVEEAEESPSDAYYHMAAQVNPWNYAPTRGIRKSADGSLYPLFVSRAKGCRIWDTEGKEYIDYAMGWGSTLLGHADDRVQKAVRDALDETGPTVHLPHPLEAEVAQMLVEDFPCADMATFGKNGSDVCTVAARLARAFTGRKYIIYSGYHGWQDFWAEQPGVAQAAIPARKEPLIYKFKFNDLDDFFRLYNKGKDLIAAVMIEPSPWGGDQVGFEPDVDRGFLEAVADATREAGALLVFDEIVTGYRYPGGGVQQATGITPDLTCLGKSLASGMPLAALVGRSDIMRQGMPQIFYGPTFRGEIYSYAAAKASIEICRKEPVAQHVWDYGEKLIAGIERIAGQAGVRTLCKGPPFRFAVVFEEPDIERFRLKRTLFVQELLKTGISTYNGVMLPSYAHDEAVLERTLEGIGRAMEIVAEAEGKDDFDHYIEIPPVVF